MPHLCLSVDYGLATRSDSVAYFPGSTRYPGWKRPARISASMSASLSRSFSKIVAKRPTSSGMCASLPPVCGFFRWFATSCASTFSRSMQPPFSTSIASQRWKNGVLRQLFHRHQLRLPPVSEQEIRGPREVAERVRQDHVRPVLVAGRPQVPRPVYPAHVRRQPQHDDVPQVRRPLPRVKHEQPVLLREVRRLVRPPLVQVLAERDARQPHRLRLLAQPLRRYVTVHRSHDRMDVHVDNRAHQPSSITREQPAHLGAGIPQNTITLTLKRTGLLRREMDAAQDTGLVGAQQPALPSPQLESASEFARLARLWLLRPYGIRTPDPPRVV